MRDSIFTSSFDSPLGPLVAFASPHGLSLLEFTDRKKIDRQMSRVTSLLGGALLRRENEHIESARAELSHYFAGRLQTFQTPLDLVGTEFQLRVWRTLAQITYGSVSSYATIAAQLGSPQAYRAVANAIGANAVALLVPCHRVIAADGGLGGYAAMTWRKKELLALEASVDRCTELG